MLISPISEIESDRSTPDQSAADRSTAARYESLIRIAASVRSQKDPKELFGLLVDELRQVVQFDGIAQYDEGSNKVHWHLCSGCRKPDYSPSEIDKEETLAAWVFQNQ